MSGVLEESKPVEVHVADDVEVRLIDVDDMDLVDGESPFPGKVVPVDG